MYVDSTSAGERKYIGYQEKRGDDQCSECGSENTVSRVEVQSFAQRQHNGNTGRYEFFSECLGCSALRRLNGSSCKLEDGEDFHQSLLEEPIQRQSSQSNSASHPQSYSSSAPYWGTAWHELWTGVLKIIGYFLLAMLIAGGLDVEKDAATLLMLLWLVYSGYRALRVIWVFIFDN